MNPQDAILTRFAPLHPKKDRPVARSDLSGFSAISARRKRNCPLLFMSPAPTARARPSRLCAPRSKRQASASMSIPRRISCDSTSVSGSRESSSATSASPTRSIAASGSMTARRSPSLRSPPRRRCFCSTRRLPRLSLARSRSRGALRCDQCDRPSGGDRHQFALNRSCPNSSARPSRRSPTRRRAS